MKQKLTIFGATGATGQQLINQALDQGYKVTAFVRNPDKLQPREDLEIYQGDINNPEDLENAIQGSDAVMITLGGPMNDTSFRAEATKNIIDAMKKTGVNRLVAMTSLGVGDSREVVPAMMRAFLLDGLLRNAIIDHNKQEEYIKNSGLDWTIARPARLTHEPRTGNYQVGVQKGDRYKSQISRADVADYMLSALKDENQINKAPVLSY